MSGQVRRSEVPLSVELFRPSANTQFLGPARVRVPYGISIGSAVLAQLPLVTNRRTQTEHTKLDDDDNAPYLM